MQFMHFVLFPMDPCGGSTGRQSPRLQLRQVYPIPRSCILNSRVSGLGVPSSRASYRKSWQVIKYKRRFLDLVVLVPPLELSASAMQHGKLSWRGIVSIFVASNRFGHAEASQIQNVVIFKNILHPWILREAPGQIKAQNKMFTALWLFLCG